MPSFLQLATSADVVRRALGYAVVVGAILIAINHGDALLRADLGLDRLARMALTVLVPYAVSTLSSVQALRGSSSEAARSSRGHEQPDTSRRG